MSPKKTLEDLTADVVTAANHLMEARIRQAMKLADVSLEDIRSGRALWASIRSNHPECYGSGVTRTRKDSVIIVELCPCLEIRIVKRVD